MPPLKLNIEKLIYGGKGLARSHTDGKVYFVSGVLPEEEILARESSISGKKNYSEALPLSVVKPSPYRVEPRCPLHIIPAQGEPSRFCGGCDFQHISYTEQLRLKKEIIRETLSRIGGIKQDVMDVADVVPSPSEFHCRNKAIIPFATSSDGKKLIAGFYAEHSHDIVEAGDCLLQKKIVFKIVNFVREVAPEYGIRGYLSSRRKNPTALGSLRHLCVRVNSRNEALVIFVIYPKENEIARYEKLSKSLVLEFNQKSPFVGGQIIGILINENPTDSNVIFNQNGWRTLYGSEFVTEIFTIPDGESLNLRVSRAGFLQVNTPVAANLYSSVSDMLFARGEGEVDFSKKIILDLYGGVGGFAITAARKHPEVKNIISVEENESAVRDALVNASDNNIDKITFYALPVERFLEKNSARLKKNVFMIVDPPRSGLSGEAMKAIIKIKPERLVYVSCDIATFSRDAKILLAAGYRPRGKIQPFDMFPQTHHVEIAAAFVSSA